MLSSFKFPVHHLDRSTNLSMEDVEDLITDDGEACADNLGSFLVENGYRFIQHEILIDPAYQAHLQP